MAEANLKATGINIVEGCMIGTAQEDEGAKETHTKLPSVPLVP